MTTPPAAAENELSIDARHYTAALEEELGQVTRERLLLRAALNQQAETLEAVGAERDRWRDLVEAALSSPPPVDHADLSTAAEPAG